MRRTLPLALAAIALALGTPSVAEARQCGKVRADGRKYAVSGSDNVSCDFMRKWSRRVARGDGHPRGWECNRGWRSGGCTRGAGFKRKFFTYRPPS
jgi:hypothetical protein